MDSRRRWSVSDAVFGYVSWVLVVRDSVQVYIDDEEVLDGGWWAGEPSYSTLHYTPWRKPIPRDSSPPVRDRM